MKVSKLFLFVRLVYSFLTTFSLSTGKASLEPCDPMQTLFKDSRITLQFEQQTLDALLEESHFQHLKESIQEYPPIIAFDFSSLCLGESMLVRLQELIDPSSIYSLRFEDVIFDVEEEPLKHFLSQFSHLNELYIDKFSSDDVKLRIIFEALHGKNIKTLSLKKGTFKTKDEDALAQFISSLFLKDLSLSETNFHDAHLKKLLEELVWLKKIDFSHTELSDRAGALLGRLISLCYSLKRLDLTGINLDLSGGHHLQHNLMKAPFLRYLDLSCTQLDKTPLGAAIQGFMKERRHTYYINRTVLPFQVRQILFHMLKNSPHVLSLDLSGHSLNKYGQKVLGKALKASHFLQHLNIQGLSFSDNEVQELSKAYQSRSTLRSLMWGGVPLSPQIIGTLHSRSFYSLTILNLSHASLGSLAAHTLLPSLVYLNLSHNSIDDQSFCLLAEKVLSHPFLEDLILDFNLMGLPSALWIDRLLKQNHRLKIFSLDETPFLKNVKFIQQLGDRLSQHSQLALQAGQFLNK